MECKFVDDDDLSIEKTAANMTVELLFKKKELNTTPIDYYTM